MEYVFHACTRGRGWRGRTNWFGSDNSNTRDWIDTRYSTVAEIAFLLRVLNMIEGMWGFSTVCFYVRTYHGN